MRSVILGAGYTGQRLGKILVEDGWEVLGTKRTPDETDERTFAGELHSYHLGKNNLRTLLENVGWSNGTEFPLVFTAGPPRRDSLQESLDLLEEFVESLPRNLCRNFVYLSSTSVYGDRNGEWVDETAERNPISSSGRLKVRAEELLRDRLEPTVPVVVLRPGGIYGPGRNAGERYLSDDYELVNGGRKWTNRIHVRDLARICARACEINRSETINAVDGNPVRLGELVEFLYEQAGKDPETITNISWEEAEAKYSEMKLGLLKTSKRVSADKLREEYNFEFVYPTVYDGLKELESNRSPE
jgi:nucleoside-diphosphate-sugar epimerase